MNKKQVRIISVIALVFTLISFIILYGENTFRKLQNNTIGKLVFPNFMDYEIKTIKIRKPSGRAVTLRKNKNKEWGVVNCFNYPADPQKINAFITELSSMKTIQNIYAGMSGLSELKLLTPKENDKNSGSEITISDDTGKIVFSIIVGLKRMDAIGDNKISRGRYIYIPESKRIILTEDPLDEVNYRSKTWLNNKPLNIGNLKAVQLFKNDKELWRLERPDIDSKFVPKGKKAQDDYSSENIENIIATLMNMKFETIANPTLSDAYTGLNSPYVVKAESFDQRSWQIYIGSQANDSRYVRIENTDNSKKSDSKNASGKKWIYLINKNRIAPLLQSSKNLLEKDKKPPNSINKMYSTPIS